MTKDEMIISALEHLAEAINRQGGDIMQMRAFLDRTLQGVPYIGGSYSGSIHEVNDRLLQLKMLNTRNEDQLQRLIKEDF